MKRFTKKIPLFPNSAKKNPYLRSPHSEKDTLFLEFPYMHVNTYRKSGPPGPILHTAFGAHLVQKFLLPQGVM